MGAALVDDPILGAIILLVVVKLNSSGDSLILFCLIL